MVALNLIGIRLHSNQNTRIKVDIDCNETVDNLKNDAAQKLNFQKEDLELTYCGNILCDNETLSKYGIKQGVTVHALKKIHEEKPAPVKKMNETDIQQLSTAFKTFKLSPNYRSVLQGLSRLDVMQNIIQASPGLNKDLVSLAILQDPELLIHLTDSQVLQRLLELHPSLVDVAAHIAAFMMNSIHDEASNLNPDVPGTSSGYSYSLEALSDDDMDSSSSEGQSSGQQSAITAAQLAAALASAQVPVNPSSSSPSNLGGLIITNEMFNNAMQQAFANVSSNSPSTGGSQSEEESIESITRRLAPQLNQMRELGLNNLVTNIQALQATGGDVQAAIDLVFSGVMSPGM